MCFFPSALFSHALIYICAFFRCAFFLCAFFQCAFFRLPLNTYCAGKRPRTGWSTRLSILKKTLRDATLRLCQRSQLTLPPLNRPTWLTTRSSNDRWEVAADIQTEEQNSSTGSINAQKHLATIQWHLEKHSLSSSRCQPSSTQRLQLLWLASQTSTWSQGWHPKSSTPRPSPQQNHQSTIQGTKAQPYENEKLASPSSYLDSPTCPTYCTNRWSQPNHHSMMLPRMTYHEDVVSYKTR